MNPAPTGASHRFFVDPDRLHGESVELDGPLAHQMARVLRLRGGDRVVLLDGSGREREVELVTVTPGRVRGVVRETRPSRGEPRLAVALYQALVPREKLELVIQKGTEVGVTAFVPIACERSLVPGPTRVGWSAGAGSPAKRPSSPVAAGCRRSAHRADSWTRWTKRRRVARRWSPGRASARARRRPPSASCSGRRLPTGHEAA